MNEGTPDNQPCREARNSQFTDSLSNLRNFRHKLSSFVSDLKSETTTQNGKTEEPLNQQSMATILQEFPNELRTEVNAMNELLNEIREIVL